MDKDRRAGSGGSLCMILRTGSDLVMGMNSDEDGDGATGVGVPCGGDDASCGSAGVRVRGTALGAEDGGSSQATAASVFGGDVLVGGSTYDGAGRRKLVSSAREDDDSDDDGADSSDGPRLWMCAG